MTVPMPVAGRAVLTAAVALGALIATPDVQAAATPLCQGERATIVGTAGRDNLTGTNGRDVIWAGGGTDRIAARGGNDLVCAGPGDDDVHGGNGTDRIRGEGGDDELDGSTGSSDLVDGGTGDDEVTASSTDTILKGGAGDDELTGKEEGTLLDGGADDDRLLALWVRLTLRGGDGDDYIKGHWNRDAAVDGGPGSDRIELGGGLDGSAGKPVLGGSGNDVILGQAGTDFIDAGPGRDDVDLGQGDGGWVHGGSGDDTLTSGTTKNTRLRGEDGNDTLTLVEIGSLADGGADADLLNGSLWDDVLEGGAGPDEVHGSEGDDTLSGSDGDDELWGELGVDVCSGGPGNDMCDGGPLGNPEPSPEDPDLCKADVETKRNCRAENSDFSGTADGTLEHTGGVIESWSANVDLEELSPDYYWLGDADIAWTVSGTSAAGCVYDGSGSLDGRAEVAIFEEEGEYSLSLWSTTVQVEVEIDCPHEDPETILYRPLNTNAAEADYVPLPPAPVTALTGTATYVPTHAPEGQVTWSWDLTR